MLKKWLHLYSCQFCIIYQLCCVVLLVRDGCVLEANVCWLLTSVSVFILQYSFHNNIARIQMFPKYRPAYNIMHTVGRYQ
jgi:hypothetical protein